MRGPSANAVLSPGLLVLPLHLGSSFSDRRMICRATLWIGFVRMSWVKKTAERKKKVIFNLDQFIIHA